MNQKKSVLLATVPLLFILLSGCAKQHWTETLEEEETAGIAQIIYNMQEEDHSCPKALDAEVLIFWKTPLENYALQGYLQLLSPSFLKFVLSNPLGQPMYIIASDGKQFQSLDMTIRRHIRGSVRSLGIRNKIPLIIMNGDWYAFFTGRLPEQPFKIHHMYRNKEEQDVWVALPATISLSGLMEHTYIHFDPVRKEILGYLFLDDKGKILANISYGDQESKQNLCNIKEQINITELSWGAEIQIKLQDIRTDIHLQENTFILPVPKDYSKQLHP